MGYCLWEPKRVRKVEQDCQRLSKAQGKICPMKSMTYKYKRKHVICDFAHRLPKLHCPWDDEAKKKRNEISPGKLYHGLHSTDVTARLNAKPPSHAAHPSQVEAPTEYHGRQAQDVTEMYTFASRGKRPPSRDYYYGREATDISEFLRIIPPVAKEGDESNEFFGRPKSDVTDYNLFPLRTIDTNSRTDAARPLGRCPPGPMCDFVPLIRDKEGKMLRLQPEKPPSPLCESGTHELPVCTTLVRRHQPESEEQQFVPGAGGILAQIVPGFSRSEAKKPVGRGVPGVMADYVQLLRDETGKVHNTPGHQHWLAPRARSPRGSCAAASADDYQQQCQSEQIQSYANRNDRKHPLGKVPVGVMHDFVANPSKGKHKHTTDGYWALPSEFPQSPPYSGPDKCPAGKTNHQQAGHVQWSPGPMSPGEAALTAADTLKGVKKKLNKDRRRNAICEMHDPGCPLAAEQGHVSSCISHPAVSSYVKWPKDGDIEIGPCKKHGGRTGIFSVRGSRCSSAGAAAAAGSSPGAAGAGSCNAYNVDESATPPEKPCSSSSSPPHQAADSSSSAGGFRSRLPRGNNNSRTDSLANQSPLKPDTACPRVACQCIRVANKGTGPPSYGHADSISRLDPKYPKKKSGGSSGSAGGGSIVSSSRGGGSQPSKASSASASKSKKPKKKSMAFVTEDTSPQHFQVPYFGLAQTYVTNPAVSPNLTPPVRRAAARNGQPEPAGQGNIPAGLPSGGRGGALVGGIGASSGSGLLKGISGGGEERKSCNQAEVCKHHHDGKSPWFGRSKTFVTDPAVSPNLTPPCFNTFR